MTATASATSSTVGASGEAIRLSWWESFSFSVIHTALFVLLKVLSLRGLYAFGCAFGTIEWVINFRRRKRFRRVLETVLQREPTNQKRRKWTRDYFVQTRCDKLIYLIFDCLPRERAVELFSIGNREKLDEAVSAGRGAYIALSHHGPLHITGLFLALLGYRVAGVRDRKESGIRRYVQRSLDLKYPELGRTRYLYADSYPREIFRCFQDGYVLGSAMDVLRARLPHQKTEAVTIFGEQRHFLSGPLRAAYRCNAAVFQGFVIPAAGFRYRLELVEELATPSGAVSEDEAVRRAMERYTVNVERFVRERPSLVTRI